MGLQIFTNWKIKSYDSILVMVDQLTKMIHYKRVKATITTFVLAKAIINMIMQYYGLLDSIVTDWGSLFNSNSGHLYATFLESNKDSQLSFIHGTIAK